MHRLTTEYLSAANAAIYPMFTQDMWMPVVWGRMLLSGHDPYDEAYLRDSILLPKKDVVAGFQPVMPSFAGQVSEEDIQALVAYIRTGAPP